MVTAEQVEILSANLPTDDYSLLLIDNAFNWLERNTTIKTYRDEVENTPTSVILFLYKYIDIMKLPDGVSSESISGLSQSFKDAEKDELLAQIASSLFGDGAVTYGQVTFAAAKNRWRR